jgi:coenzyme F420-reducing hydrogenase delta subunit
MTATKLQASWPLAIGPRLSDIETWNNLVVVAGIRIDQCDYLSPERDVTQRDTHHSRLIRELKLKKLKILKDIPASP